MILRALALDYDGTIATNGTLSGSVRAAILRARTRGLVVILGTGRILRDLERQVGDLRLFDAVVGENGATLALPESGRLLTLATPFVRFATILRQRGLAVDFGECVVEAEARLAPTLLEIIRELQLPLVPIFNRERVMILPIGVSKSTGLRSALRILRLSPHNLIAVGDAENDHDLLAFAEFGLAVDWGSPMLKQHADAVLPGKGPAAVAELLDQVSDEPVIPYPVSVRRRVLLGYEVSGFPVTLGVRGRNVLIVGEAKTGKSWVAGLLAEQYILFDYSLCIVDPEGDYSSLDSLPGVRPIRADETELTFHQLVQIFQDPDARLRYDLSRVPLDQKRALVTRLLADIGAIRRETGVPHRVLVDEAHYFLSEAESFADVGFDLDGFTVVTHRATGVHPRVLDAVEAVIVTRESNPVEIEALSTLLRPWNHLDGLAAQLRSVEEGEALLCPNADEANQRYVRFRVAGRLTRHVRHRQKYLDIPVAAHHAFVFTRDGLPIGRSAQTFRGFVEIVAELSPEILAGHLLRGDVSRWIRDVFGDRTLEGTVLAIESRARREAGSDLGSALVSAIGERYGID